ncbi:unnamed protein product [Absidia cylindrospora]
MNDLNRQKYQQLLTKITTTTATNYNNNNTSSSWGHNSGQKPSSSSILDTSSGSWASIASTKPANDTSSDWNSTTTVTNSTTTTVNDPWAHQEITEMTTSSALLNDSDKPKSWASLLKDQQNTDEPGNDDDAWNTTNDKPANDDQNTSNNELVKDDWNATVEIPTDAWEFSTTEPVETKIASKPVEDDDKAKKTIRNSTQGSPVVMPNNDVTVSDVDVKFGSLNLDQGAAQEPSFVEESLTDTKKIETQPQAQGYAEPMTEQNYSNNNLQPAHVNQQKSTYSQSQILQQHQLTPAQIQPAQPQIQQSTQPQQFLQQPSGIDHLTSAYSSYPPNQPPTGVSAFGMNHMGNFPDYGNYGTEAQRAAAMGYYDPSNFNNSPSVTNASAYPSRDKFGQDISAPLGTPQGQQSTPGQNQGLHGQQMYPGMPYYPYYYMPNHYNAYQQSVYGQPMMNKNIYPNVYQQQTASINKPTTHSPYSGNNSGAAATAAASPYSLHSQLYSQSPNVGGSNSGYDDLQQSFGGLHDYQKSPYGNTTQGFLGQQNQQQPSSQQQSTFGQGQSGDLSKNGISSSQPQQQVQQQPMNYSGQQQHMFSYQQYPQQQYWNQ